MKKWERIQKKWLTGTKTRVHGHKIKMESLSIPLASPWHILLSAIQKWKNEKKNTEKNDKKEQKLICKIANEKMESLLTPPALGTFCCLQCKK